MTHPLCFRCEFRTLVMEGNPGPRSECNQTDKAVHACYMYRPVAPLILKPIKGEKRPILAHYYLSGRCHSVGIAEGEYHAVKRKNGTVAYWRPKK